MWDPERDTPEYKAWALAVKRRDGWHCQVCFRIHKPPEQTIVAHHLNSFNLFINQRLMQKNGISLCNKCHDLFHSLYQRGNNTWVQFEEFKKLVKLLEKLAVEASQGEPPLLESSANPLQELHKP